MDIAFLLNGETVRLSGINPTRTLLDWLREDRALTGTKEGCNEGDCGACTVTVRDDAGARAMNACILFLPQLNGKSVTTVEGLTAPDGTAHPVQDTMVEHHGSQCGFCTPGFVMSMATAHANGNTDHDTTLAGNLCRCTGYAPIIRAAKAAEGAPIPPHLGDEIRPIPETPSGGDWIQPTTSDELAAWYAANPEATLVAGATDIGLWVTKHLTDLKKIAFLNRVEDLQGIQDTGEVLAVGAGVSITDLGKAVADFAPSFADMIKRYGSTQVRNAATIGGNIANGSPIGDTPPALIALGATLYLRHGDDHRNIPLEDFFVSYGKQDIQAGEFVIGVVIPKQAETLRCYKISKRFDQDISALCGCFNVMITDGIVTDARIAFGGMAGTPHRAKTVETALIGKPWTIETVTSAAALFGDDYTPMSDARASADYRLETASNLLIRYFHDLSGAPVSVLEVTS